MPDLEVGEGDEPLRPQWLVVRVGTRALGIPVEQVREVVRADGLVSVPGTPLAQAGIVNVRGAIVTVLDGAAVLTGVRAPAPASIVLVEHGARAIGVAVDAVQDVRDVTDRDADGADDAIELLDAAAMVAAQVHSAEERER